MSDADRYIWLLAHVGKVTKQAELWQPIANKPLLKHLQDYIDTEMKKESADWFDRQRRLLK